MDKFTTKLEGVLAPIANKFAANKSLQAVMYGFMTILPLTLLGAMATLLASLQIKEYQAFIVATHLKTIFAFVPSVTTGMLAIYSVYSIAKALADRLGYEKHATIIGVISLFVFLMMIPLGVTGVSAVNKEVVVIGAALSTKFLGSAGIFSAILIGLLVPRLYILILKMNWVIKMPEGVPPAVANSFAALIPGFIIAITFALVRYGFTLTAYVDLNSFLYTTVQAPLKGLTASPITFMIFLFMVSLFWFFGIHGGMVVMPLLTALYLPLSLENLAAYGAGSALPNLIVQSDWFIYGMIGGGGATIGFALWMSFFAKSKRYKSLGRLALPASLCGINEPITFGAPVVMNPLLMIPFFLTPQITFGLSYLARILNLVPALNGVEIPTGTPLFLSAFLAGGWPVVVLQIVLVGVTLLCYAPFAAILDKKALAEEK